MQLKNKAKPTPIQKSLALATATLLSSVPNLAQAQSSSDWDIEASMLYYSEVGRVSATAPTISARKEIGDDEFMSVRAVTDTLSGASPSGAIALDTAQTFSGPSGSGDSYTTPANETPLDPNFSDFRTAVNAVWEKPLNQYLRGTFSFNTSKETDYLSYGFSSSFSWDFNNRNTTLTTGISANFDTITPVGGIPVGLGPRAIGGGEVEDEDEGEGSEATESTHKQVLEFIVGVTQVIDRRTLMQFNFSYAQDDGYLNDPYKIISVVLTPTSTTLDEIPYLYEKRPGSRTKNSAYWKTVHQFENSNVLNISYRYFWDDWGVTSQTIDAHYRMELGNGHYLTPHVRYYIQDKADFYTYKLVREITPDYASADYRLADMTTTTVGLKYGIDFDNSKLAFRAEYMLQESAGNDPFPDVEANIYQVYYSMVF